MQPNIQKIPYASKTFFKLFIVNLLLSLLLGFVLTFAGMLVFGPDQNTIDEENMAYGLIAFIIFMILQSILAFAISAYMGSQIVKRLNLSLKNYWTNYLPLVLVGIIAVCVIPFLPFVGSSLVAAFIAIYSINSCIEKLQKSMVHNVAANQPPK